jgi:LysM repeat protein
LATRLRGTGAVYRGGDDREANMGQSSANTASRTSSNVRYHKVKKGETLSAIARKHGTTVQTLCNLNRISSSVRLHPGQILMYN